MHKKISPLVVIVLMALLVTCVFPQKKKSIELPGSAIFPSLELLLSWNSIGKKVITMAQDFPQDKYDFKAQKDERTFAENLLHIAAVEYAMMRAMKGTPMGPAENVQDSLRKIYTTKEDIVKLVTQAAADGSQLIKKQGDAGLMKTFKYPGKNFLIHGSFGWWSILEHTGEHYGQLVVYYRLNGLIPPESRSKK
jgi:uncharacterized damage-inducible protein DinB